MFGITIHEVGIGIQYAVATGFGVLTVLFVALAIWRLLKKDWTGVKGWTVGAVALAAFAVLPLTFHLLSYSKDVLTVIDCVLIALGFVSLPTWEWGWGRGDVIFAAIAVIWGIAFGSYFVTVLNAGWYFTVMPFMFVSMWGFMMISDLIRPYNAADPAL